MGGTPVGPATPRARLHLPTPLRSSSLCWFALSSANASSSRSARSAARHRRRSRSGRASSPELAPSRPEHRLLLARLVLASVSHGSSPSPRIPRWSHGRAHQSTPLRGPRPSVLPHTIVSHARETPELGEAPTPLLAPPLGRRWPADDEPHHRAAMAAG